MSKTERIIYQAASESAGRVELPVARPDLVDEVPFRDLLVVISSAGVVYDQKTRTLRPITGGMERKLLERVGGPVIIRPGNVEEEDFMAAGEPINDRTLFDKAYCQALDQFNPAAIENGRYPQAARVECYPVNREAPEIVIRNGIIEYHLRELDFTSGFVIEDKDAALRRLTDETGLSVRIAQTRAFLQSKSQLLLQRETDKLKFIPTLPMPSALEVAQAILRDSDRSSGFKDPLIESHARDLRQSYQVLWQIMRAIPDGHLFSNQNTSQLAAGMNGSQKNLPEGILRSLLRSSSSKNPPVVPHRQIDHVYWSLPETEKGVIEMARTASIARSVLLEVLRDLPKNLFLNPAKMGFPDPAVAINAWIYQNMRFPEFEVAADYADILYAAVKGHFRTKERLRANYARYKKTAQVYASEVRLACEELIYEDFRAQD